MCTVYSSCKTIPWCIQQISVHILTGLFWNLISSMQRDSRWSFIHELLIREKKFQLFFCPRNKAVCAREGERNYLHQSMCSFLPVLPFHLRLKKVLSQSCSLQVSDVITISWCVVPQEEDEGNKWSDELCMFYSCGAACLLCLCVWVSYWVIK